jgi:hypothetical protein
VRRQAAMPMDPIASRDRVRLKHAFSRSRFKGVKLTTVGTNSTGTASFYIDLQHAPKGRDEPASCTLKKYDSLTKWFSDNWPEGRVIPRLRDPSHYPTGPTTAPAAHRKSPANKGKRSRR